MTSRTTTLRRAAVALGLGLTVTLSGCAEDSQSGDSYPDRQSDEVPLPGEPSEAPA